MTDSTQASGLNMDDYENKNDSITLTSIRNTGKVIFHLVFEYEYSSFTFSVRYILISD